jgi:hypothetical protein
VNFDGLLESHFHGALLVTQLSYEFRDLRRSWREYTT